MVGDWDTSRRDIGRALLFWIRGTHYMTAEYRKRAFFSDDGVLIAWGYFISDPHPNWVYVDHEFNLQPLRWRYDNGEWSEVQEISPPARRWWHLWRK